MKWGKILIVEDDFVSGKILEKMMLKMGYSSIGIESSAENTLLRIMTDKPDLILMDIELSGAMDGIHIAEILSKFSNIPIIFVTSRDDAQTVARAKDLGLGYIVKPFFENDIKVAIDRHTKPATKSKHSKENDVSEQSVQQERIMVKNGAEIVFLDLYSILYFESEGHTIFIHTKDDTYSLRGSLSSYESLDKSNRFVRCHKSFLVNIDSVESIINNQGHYQIKIKGCDSYIDLSRNKVKSVKQSIIWYVS